MINTYKSKMDSPKPKKSLYALFMNDLICGSFAGLALVLSGHPFDSMKVRMQTETTLSISFRQQIASTFKHEGILGFYKGMGSPLVTVPLINSIVFSSYEIAKRYQGIAVGEDGTFRQSMYAGMFAGLVNSIILSPIELVKCRLQIQREAKSEAYYKGPVDCVKKIIQEEGIQKGLFKGLIVSTLSREVPCYAGQFGAFYATKQLLVILQGLQSTSELGPLSLMFAGGMGGFFTWLVSYPQDVIKTKLQIERGPTQFTKFHPLIPDGGMVNCAKYIYKNEGGFMGFWRGFSACSARAVLANSFMFLAYEFAQRHNFARNFTEHEEYVPLEK